MKTIVFVILLVGITTVSVVTIHDLYYKNLELHIKNEQQAEQIDTDKLRIIFLGSLLKIPIDSTIWKNKSDSLLAKYRTTKK